jgi:hypothetical protein
VLLLMMIMTLHWWMTGVYTTFDADDHGVTALTNEVSAIDPF